MCEVKTGSRRSICVKEIRVDTCGNGFIEIENFESCDDSNRNNSDGCSSQCQVESGYACSEPVVSIASYCLKICGNGYYEKRFRE